MTTIKTVQIKHIQPNPHRGLDVYPYNERKIKTLQASIEDVGLWEGVIAREKNGGYQLAFGHHRVEAAKRSGLTKIPVIVRDLTDEDMLKFMGRENGEDYTSEFLIMLNTWDAAVSFSPGPGKKSQDLDIAKVLGWTRTQTKNGKTYAVMTHTAGACSIAARLIADGHLTRADLDGLTVSDVDSLVSRVSQRMKAMDNIAKKTNTPKKEVDHGKTIVARGAKAAAKRIKKGEVAHRDVRAEVDVQAHKAAKRSKKQTPLFSVLATAMTNQLERILSTDAHNDKLNEIEKAVQHLTSPEDSLGLDSILFELEQLSKRAQLRHDKLEKARVNVVELRPNLKAITHEDSV